MASSSGSSKIDTQMIKRSIAYRAKYRKGQGPGPYIKTFSPALAVPHPRNRGGDAILSQVTKKLGCTIAIDGHDPVEAASSAVAVEAHAHGKLNLVWGTFQSHFEKQVSGKDPDMAYILNGVVAVIGTLSHGHNNCLSRNIFAGMSGCDCGAHSRGDGEGKCECPCKMILDEKGCYDLERLRAHDASWSEHVEKGIGWELLVPEMDDEEPDAALVISIAQNKKNEACMSTAHTEVMKTLVGLCKPDPNGDRTVLFEPIRERMIDLYGAIVDHPDFHHAFRLVLDAGGCDSPHMKDMNDFTSVHVNQHFRKLRFETYAVVAVLPIEYPALKNGLVKWAWKQKPVKGWCPVPPTLQHRLDPKSKHHMPRAATQIEDAMRGMRTCLAAVAAGVPNGEKMKITWVGAVDIGLAQLLLNVPKTEEGKTVAEQEEALITKCSEFLAVKLHGALQVTSKAFEQVAHQLGAQEARRKGNLLERARSLMEDGSALHILVTEASKEKDKPTAVAVSKQTLQPEVAQLDASGKVLSTPAVKTKQEAPIEIIRMKGWLDAMTKEDEASGIKAVLKIAILQAKQQYNPDVPIAIARQGNDTWVKATQPIKVGELAVPLYIRQEQRMILRDYEAGIIHPNAVNAVVSCPTTEEERLTGLEESHRDITISVQPEFKLPAKPAVAGTTSSWDQKDNGHPFWAIPRRKTQAEDPNCVIESEVTTVIVCCQPKPPLDTKAVAATVTYSVRLPYIVNNRPIGADEKVILEWAIPEKKKAVRKDETWADDVAKLERKRTKKGSGGDAS